VFETREEYRLGSETERGHQKFFNSHLSADELLEWEVKNGRMRRMRRMRRNMHAGFRFPTITCLKSYTRHPKKDKRVKTSIMDRRR
jgi:hypothetical protein